MKKWIFLCIISFLLLGCNEDTIHNEPQLVVEGWIENGKFPIIMLTTTLPIKTEYQDFDHLEKYILKWAKVTISDGTKETILTGTVKKQFEPPFIYTTTDMRGVVGKTYKLRVKYKDFYAESETTIPDPVEFKSLETVSVGNGKYKIEGTIADQDSAKNYYKIFSLKIPDDTYYLSFYPCVFHDGMAETQKGIDILRGTKSSEELDSPYFEEGDTVMVKLAQIDEKGYTFWKNFEQSCALSRNPLFFFRENIYSNIKGGLGYWCGYGAKEYRVIINDQIINNKRKEYD